jgi:CheY-like chemotaxis protein
MGDYKMKHEQLKSMSMSKKHVLLVDDEDLMISTEQHMLEGYLNCKVTALTSSVEALEVFRAKPYHFDLVISDMIMPKMTGDIFVNKLLAIRPDIPVILCTAYSERTVINKAEKIGVAFLMKPFDLYELGKALLLGPHLKSCP